MYVVCAITGLPFGAPAVGEGETAKPVRLNRCDCFDMYFSFTFLLLAVLDLFDLSIFRREWLNLLISTSHTSRLNLTCSPPPHSRQLGRRARWRGLRVYQTHLNSIVSLSADQQWRDEVLIGRLCGIPSQRHIRRKTGSLWSYPNS